MHNGYFSIDKRSITTYSEIMQDSKPKAEESTYNLIMRDKEMLLSLDNKLRFIFSHSALGVGWDNPNVFQICTLAENRQEVDRRQKIGRGLRLCVNQNGERITDPRINILTIIANESYEEFAKQLQHEIERDNKDIRFGMLDFRSFATIKIQVDGITQHLGEQKSKAIYDFLQTQGYIDSKGKIQPTLEQAALLDNFIELPDEFIAIKDQIQSVIKKHTAKLKIRDGSKKRTIGLKNEVYEDPDFIALWDSIKYKTKYSVEFNTKELIKKCTSAIKENKKEFKNAIIVSRTARLKIQKEGVDYVNVDSSNSDETNEVSYYPDIITFLQNKTNLTRKTIVDILIKSDTLEYFKKNPQNYMSEVARIIQRELMGLILNGIKYTKLGNDSYYQQELLKEPITDYLDGLLESKSDKYPFTHIVCDSKNEKDFATQFEKQQKSFKMCQVAKQVQNINATRFIQS